VILLGGQFRRAAASVERGKQISSKSIEILRRAVWTGEAGRARPSPAEDLQLSERHLAFLSTISGEWFSSVMSKRVLLDKCGDGMETGGDVEEQQEVRKGRGKEKKMDVDVGSTGRVSSGCRNSKQFL
jgi:hypothetical protein